MRFALILVALSGMAPCPAATRVETLATFAPGTSLQGIDRAPDGTVYLTDYAHDTLWRVSPDGHSSLFVADLPIHPQGILVTRTGFLVSGHVNRPSADASLSLTERFRHLDGRVLVLDRHGAILKSLVVGADTFPNGMTRLDRHTILLADSLAGAVWQIDPDAGTVRAWTRDPLVQPVPSFPGANGIKVHDHWVYVSNTSKAQILRIPLGADGQPAGAAQSFAATPRVDELTIAADGTLYAASHGPMLEVSAQGVTGTAFPDVAGGSTLMLAPDQKSIYVATDSTTVEGVKGPAHLLRVWIEPAAAH